MTDLSKEALDALDGLRAWIEAEAEDRGTADALYPPERQCSPALALITALRQQIAAAKAAALERAAHDMDMGWSYNAGNHIRALITREAASALAAREAAADRVGYLRGLRAVLSLPQRIEQLGGQNYAYVRVEEISILADRAEKGGAA